MATQDVKRKDAAILNGDVKGYSHYSFLSTEIFLRLPLSASNPPIPPLAKGGGGGFKSLHLLISGLDEARASR
jgi:hypothetical protein